MNLDYLNKLANQIDLCFPKLYFSPSIQTKIERIEKNYWLILIGLIKLFESQR